MIWESLENQLWHAVYTVTDGEVKEQRHWLISCLVVCFANGNGPIKSIYVQYCACDSGKLLETNTLILNTQSC